jgi:ferredoxin-NADP reductase
MTTTLLSAPDVPVEDSRSVPRELRIHQVTWEAEDVISIRLQHPRGKELPAWEPGAHLDVVLPSGLIRQYSLCGDPEDRYAYTIAVLLEVDGRGGSRELHETALAGSTLVVRGPRNHFTLEPADSYLLIAGGVGITPILAMVRLLSRGNAPWRLVYGGRSRKSMAFREELDGLGGDRVEFVPQDEHGLLDLDEVLSSMNPGTHVYCCGPSPMIAAVEKRCQALKVGRLHVERFAAAEASPVDAGGGDMPAGDSNQEFEVELRRTGATVTVPPGITVLEAIRDVVPEVMTSCEEGFCGTCETQVLEGTPEHHDTILSTAERERGNTMMICVGRACSRRLVLDL